MSEAQGSNAVVPVASTGGGGTTTFQDDTVGQASSLENRISPVGDLVAQATVPGVSTLLDFLKKPTRIATGNLSTTDSTKLFQIDPYQSLLTSVKQNKLYGVGLIRADICVKLEVNAVRFQQGRYILGFYPFAGQPSYGNAIGYNAHTSCLTAITQLPHVEIDLATETHASLTIPFLSDDLFLSTQSLVTYGTLFLIPYSALQAGSGDTTCAYTVWAWFDNITLSAPALPQMSFNVRKTPSRKEQEKGGFGPVSGVAAKIGKTASILGEIPILGPAMATVSWLSDVVRRSATIWGFSKPVVLSPPVRYVREVLPYLAAGDQMSAATPLFLSANNEVIVNSGVSGMNVDEMAFDYIKKRWAYVSSFTWSNQSTDTALATFNLRPNDYGVTVGKGTCYAPFAMVAQCFNLWRGGIKLRFKLVKTEFHSGRLLVSFTPAFNGAAPAWTLAASEYLYREVVDIRDCAEFEVELPYIQPDLWLETGAIMGTITAAIGGVLEVTVLDALVAPSTVTSSINVLVEACAADDFELAFPDWPQLQPYSPAVPMSSYEIAPPIKLGSQKVTDPLFPHAVSIGERFTSLRQLLKRTNFAIGQGIGSSNSTISMAPYTTEWVTQATSNSSALIRCSDTFLDHFALWSSMFLFSSGSVGVRMFDSGNINVCAAVVLYRPNSNSTGNTIVANSNGLNNYGQIRHAVLGSQDARYDLIVPSYHRRLARVNHLQIVTPTITSSVTTGACTNSVEILWYGASGTTMVVGRPVADDFNLGFFLGTVPVVTATAT